MDMARGGVVRVYLVDNIEYLWHGASGSLCLSELDRLAQGGGYVWCRSCINDMPGKIKAKIHVLKMV
jgi:hypothetical protein